MELLGHKPISQRLYGAWWYELLLWAYYFESPLTLILRSSLNSRLCIPCLGINPRSFRGLRCIGVLNISKHCSNKTNY